MSLNGICTDIPKQNMFVIPCKYNPKFPFVIQLVESIREFHPTEKIVVVDSNSDDKSYFSILEKYDVIIEDVKNTNWMVVHTGTLIKSIQMKIIISSYTIL